MLLFLFGMTIARGSAALRERFGAIERGFYLAVTVWFVVFGLACVGIS